nr:uncharacterized protein LOC127309108 [Lolium perenne]
MSRLSLTCMLPKHPLPHSPSPVLAKLLVTTAVDAPAFPLIDSSPVTSFTLSLREYLQGVAPSTLGHGHGRAELAVVCVVVVARGTLRTTPSPVSPAPTTEGNTGISKTPSSVPCRRRTAIPPSAAPSPTRLCIVSAADDGRLGHGGRGAHLRSRRHAASCLCMHASPAKSCNSTPPHLRPRRLHATPLRRPRATLGEPLSASVIDPYVRAGVSDATLARFAADFRELCLRVQGIEWGSREPPRRLHLISVASRPPHECECYRNRRRGS